MVLQTVIQTQLHSMSTLGQHIFMYYFTEYIISNAVQLHILVLVVFQ